MILDSPNGDSVRWPGVVLIMLGLLLTPVYYTFSLPFGRSGTRKPSYKLFKISLLIMCAAALLVIGMFLSDGYEGILWFYPAVFFGIAGLLAMFTSLFVRNKF